MNESSIPFDDAPNVFDISPAKDILGFEFRPIKDTLIDACSSYIQRGVVTKPEK
jgi:hypothetical protein